jgi:hypothetical protein
VHRHRRQAELLDDGVDDAELTKASAMAKLLCGDVGTFTDYSQLDNATLRHAKANMWRIWPMPRRAGAAGRSVFRLFGGDDNHCLVVSNVRRCQRCRLDLLNQV